MTEKNDPTAQRATSSRLNSTDPGWTVPSQVSNMVTAAGPGCASINGVDWVIWQGKADNAIYYTCWTGSAWSEPAAIPSAFTSTDPAITVYNNQIYVAWKTTTGGRIALSSFNGEEWMDPPISVSASGLYTGPGLASYDGKLYIAWNSENGSNIINYSWFDGFNLYAPRATNSIYPPPCHGHGFLNPYSHGSK
ncbi:hypothetical protein EDC90_11042 [Martelella mediterranea]|uniref:Exo-alpha-sialidase n=1 Tax=Martelella mediterranea TaxID=293089 RepID=A0A4R3NDG1_9HYPH|nr:hypothetical protein EDC90_11042 [Martelella mediterranea]